MLRLRSSLFQSAKLESAIIPIFGIVTFILQIDYFYGEDIVNARNNYLIGAKTDFWGGISTLVYAHVPDFGFRWQIWLAIFQITLTTIGLNKFIKISRKNLVHQLTQIFVIYSALLFASQMTRDGLMFSLLLFGFALFHKSLSSKNQTITLLISCTAILLGISFRPWLSIAIIPIVCIILKNSKKEISRVSVALFLLVIVIVPVITEYTAARTLRLTKSYPEQQVMMMDVAASYCYTNNYATGKRAETALKLFTSDELYPKKACQLYRPDTWLSLTKPVNASSAGLSSDFWLIQAGDDSRYSQLRSTWLRMIVSDPVTYLQNKVMFAGKMIIGSDMRQLTFLSESDSFKKALALYRVPYEIAISLHLYSLLSGMIFLAYRPISRFLRRKSDSVSFGFLELSLFLSLFIWLGLSSIAYIGSNGRYTYTITLIAMVLILSCKDLRENRKIDA